MEDQNIKIAVDAVVFGYKEEKLHVLLIKQKYGQFKGQWALPGGFVKNKETLSQAVKRELSEETNVQLDYTEQLYTFGDQVDRDPRAQVISVAYLALVNPKKLNTKADTDAQAVGWFQADQIPDLPFDHNQIIEKGLERLKSKVHYKPLGFELLEDEFIFSDLENLYKAILQADLDRRNFRKKILSFGILEETNKLKKQGSGRPAMLYKFNHSKYKELEREGFHFEIKFA